MFNLEKFKKNNKLKLSVLTKEEITKLQEEIKNLGLKVNLTSLKQKELFLKTKDGIPLIEFLIKENIEINGLDDIIEKNPEIILLFVKHQKSLEKYDISTELLFSKYEGKQIIEYILETNYYINHPEIIEKLLGKTEEDEYIFEEYLDDPSSASAIFKIIDDSQVILEMLRKYRYDRTIVSLIPSEKLLFYLPTGIKVIYQLLEQNYNFEYLDINNLEIVKILYWYGRPDIMKRINIELLLNRIYEDQPKTYFDYILEEYKRGKIELKFDVPIDIKTKAKYYVALARNDMIKYIKLDVDELDKSVELKSKTSFNGKIEKTRTTLLLELLKEDREITLNKILTPEIRENILIDQIYQFDFKGIENVESVVGSIIEKQNIHNKYNNTNQYQERIAVSPEAEQLLCQLEQLFLNDGVSDKNLINLLITGYKKALLIDYDINIIEIKKLIKIKQTSKKFYYIKDDKKNYFSFIDGSIHCVESLDTNIILHETGHALHHYVICNKIPYNFNATVEKAKQNEGLFQRIEKYELYLSQMEQKLFEQLKESCDEHLERYFRDYQKKIEDFITTARNYNTTTYLILGVPREQIEPLFEGIINTEKYIECMKNIMYKEKVQEMINKAYPELRYINDILDAIYGGKFFNGVMENRLANKKIRLDGHGINYYSNEKNVFSEIVANFSVLLKLGKTEMLKEIIGEYIYALISYVYYEEILGITEEKGKESRR